MDIAHVTQAATQLLNTEMALKKAKGAAAAPASAPAPVKKFPLLPVLGGVGGVGVLAVVAVLMMNKNPAVPAGGAAPASQGTQPAAPNGSAPNPQTAQPNPRTPATRQPTSNQPPNTAANTSNTTPSASATANWADTLKAANDAFDAEQVANARRLGSAVFAAPGVPGTMKARAAMLVATTWSGESTDRALDWYRNALRYEPNNQRIRQAITDLGGTP